VNDSEACDPNGVHDRALTGQSTYLDRLMRRESFAALWPLFAKGPKPAKELTESFSALEHLRPLIRPGEPVRVLHIGDGAHARTAALFSIKTQARNVSVDPVLNEPLVEAWRDQFGIERFEWRKARIEAVAAELNDLPAMRTLVTFVHAHVRIDRVLAMPRSAWLAAYPAASFRRLTAFTTAVRTRTFCRWDASFKCCWHQAADRIKRCCSRATTRAGGSGTALRRRGAASLERRLSECV